jgi:transposase-like protein
MKFMRKLMKRHGTAHKIITDGLRSYKAAMKELGNSGKQVVGRYAAYSTASWAGIPRERGHVFHAIVGSHSTGSWAPWIEGVKEAGPTV